MGQYYYPVSIDRVEYLYSHDYDGNGLKLMEHSYQHNSFVGPVLKMLSPGGRWHKNRIVWAGDYGEKTFADFRTGDTAVDVVKEIDVGSENVHGAVQQKADAKLPPGLPNLTDSEWADHIVVNHTKKQYYRSRDLYPVGGVGGDDFVICPLPILTSDGNGMGGGDYLGEGESLVGLWAGDVISVEFGEAPEGYEDIKPDFKEE